MLILKRRTAMVTKVERRLNELMRHYINEQNEKRTGDDKIFLEVFDVSLGSGSVDAHEVEVCFDDTPQDK
jgi:hypothetical protein